MPTDWIDLHDVRRDYQRGSHTVHALDGVSMAAGRGEFLAIVGSSGSGKSTLLNLIAGLDRPTSGSVRVAGQDLMALTRRELSRYRSERIGMVFQSFQLIGHRTALQNVELALSFSPDSRDRSRRSLEVLERLGLGDRVDHRPSDLSGGEQQRVALARALVKQPELLLADEPTGNLDRENTLQIAELLSDLNRQGQTILMVTHDGALAEQLAGRRIQLQYGRVLDTASETTAGVAR